MKKILPLLILPGILLYACSNNKQENPNSSQDDSSGQIKNRTAGDRPAKTDYYTIQGDSLLIAPFEVEIVLSPKAKNRIVLDKETIIVNVVFDGTPKQSPELHLEEDGSFFVGTASKEVEYGEVVRFDSIKIPKAIYDQLADKDFTVGVSAYSGRKSSENNLINCDPLFDNISRIVNKKFIVKGKLIYGDD